MKIKGYFNKIIINLYGIFPRNYRHVIGSNKLLKPFREVILRSKNGFRIVSVDIKRQYLNCGISFVFFASIKTASDAHKSGIETKVLNNSLKLVEQYFSKRANLVVFDVGANFGFLSAVWTSTLAKEGVVYAFEPNKRVFDCIEKTINANGWQNNLRALNLAVGRENGIIPFNISMFSSNRNNMEAKSKTEIINMVNLDSFKISNSINHIDLIKIDVDGLELEILEGASEIVRKKRTMFIVETNDNMDIVRFFTKHDYQILDMDLVPLRTTKHLPPNIFCIPTGI